MAIKLLILEVQFKGIICFVTEIQAKIKNKLELRTFCKISKAAMILTEFYLNILMFCNENDIDRNHAFYFLNTENETIFGSNLITFLASYGSMVFGAQLQKETLKELLNTNF